MAEQLEPRRMLAATVQDLGAVADTSERWGAELNGVMYFAGRTDATGYELWRSDGTPGWTWMVKDIIQGQYSTWPIQFVKFKNAIYFATFGDDGLYRTDGTANGTVKVLDLPQIVNLTVEGDKLFFTAEDPTYGDELFVSDGTKLGTQRISDLQPGFSGHTIGLLYPYQGKLYFQCAGSGTGLELGVSDGTAAGTFLVKDIYPGTSNGYPVDFRGLNGKVYFMARNTGTNYELWVTDGTPGGTVLAKEATAGTTGSYIHPTLVVGNTLYSVSRPLSGVEQLWKTDGATGATTLVKKVSDEVNARVLHLTELNGGMIFSGWETSRGGELWRSDGTAAGTGFVKEIRPGSAGGMMTGEAEELNGFAVFRGNDGVNGDEPWITDGTAAGTHMLADLVSGSGGSNANYFRRMGNMIFFLSTLSPGGSSKLYAVTIDAPVAKGSVTGKVFNDTDGDGSIDSGEAALSAWTVFIDKDHDGALDSGEASDTTDANGAYSFSNLLTGPYDVAVVLKSGWNRTQPPAGVRNVIVNAGQNVTNTNFGNRTAATNTASIAGALFNDLDSDGVKDSGEGALSGWKVFLDADKDGVLDSGEKTATTDASGNYKFSALAAGSYRVREVTNSGWRRTAPSSGYFDVTLASAQAVTGKNFGNTQKVLISGNLFNDLDGDGTKDSGEGGLSNWKVYLDSDKDGVWDSAEKYVMTDGSGNYSFKTLAAGSYRVREVLPSGWRRTTPSSGYFDLTLSNGASSTGKNFGNTQKILVSGTVFNDLDGDKVKDSGEVGLSGWKVFIDSDSDGVWDSSEKYVTTSSSGSWSFKNLTAGTYRVRVVQQTGWTRTTPTSGYHSVTLSSGGSSTGKLFGEKK